RLDADPNITRVKQVEPRLSSAFRRASSDSAHNSHINPLDKESRDAYASDFPRRRRNGSRFREPGLGAILSAAAALWLRRSAIWLQQRLRPERLWAVRFDPGAAQPGRA